VVVVTGPRQAGKSTFVQAAPQLTGRPYVTLDDATTARRAREAPEAFVQSAPFLTIDEVQRNPDLILAIKLAVDPPQPRVPGQFVLTGSANLLMMRRVADSLAGRAYYLTLWPMTRREQLGLGVTGEWEQFFQEPVARWPDLLRADIAPAESWRDAVRRGDFPTPTTMADPLARDLWFQGYIDTYVRRDLQDLAAVEHVVDVRRLMQATALRIGNLLNQTELARDIQLPPTTVHRYLDLLETSYQIVRLHPYTVNRTKRLIKTPKVYWNDAALALHVGGGPHAVPSGTHLENLVLCDLLAWRDLQVPRPEILYWRTTSGQEVDFVIEWQQQLIPIEVKASERPTPRDAAGLRTFLEEYPEWPGGLLLHGGSEVLLLGERIVAAPWWSVI
jgi:predicted AAA+ superfamily ATPase